MTNEFPRFAQEQELHIALPKTLVSNFLAGSLTEHATPVRDLGKSTLYRCFTLEHPLADIERSVLHVDYRKYSETLPGRFNEMRFNIVQRPPDGSGEDQTVAEMHLSLVDTTHLRLDHRYVEPTFRGKGGIGGRLLAIAEAWVQERATQQGETLEISLHAGQPNVITWAQKQGYTVVADQQDLLEEILQHPERFVLDRAVQRSDLKKDPYLFEVGTSSRKRDDAVRLRFIKRFTPRTV